jgi:hypothetical protein
METDPEALKTQMVGVDEFFIKMWDRLPKDLVNAVTCSSPATK